MSSGDVKSATLTPVYVHCVYCRAFTIVTHGPQIAENDVMIVARLTTNTTKASIRSLSVTNHSPRGCLILSLVWLPNLSLIDAPFPVPASHS